MTTSMAVSSDLALRLAEAACVPGSFALADGGSMDGYFDEYKMAADPHLLHDVAAVLAALIPDGTEVLAGIELGGISLVTALSAATGLPAAFVRKSPKRYGSKQQVEGASLEGRRTVLVDDVVRSGGQILAMARLLRVAGAPVSGALCVLERPLGGRLLLEEHGIGLHRLLAESDLLGAREAAS